jgi:hypothetical protein
VLGRPSLFNKAHLRRVLRSGATITELYEVDEAPPELSWLPGLTKIMLRVSQELSLKRAGRAKATKPDEEVGRTDSFMGRLVPHGDDKHREFLLIEIKRPSLVIG